MTLKMFSRKSRSSETVAQMEERYDRLFRGAKTPLEIMEVSALIMRENDAAARRAIDAGHHALESAHRERDALMGHIERLKELVTSQESLIASIEASSAEKDAYVAGSSERFNQIAAINQEMQATAAVDWANTRGAFRLMADYGQLFAQYAEEGNIEAILNLAAEQQETSHQIADSFATRIPGIHTLLMEPMNPMEPDQNDQNDPEMETDSYGKA